ncbi:MAG: TrmB family transcriptional regulator [Halobacteriota archaeon]
MTDKDDFITHLMGFGLTEKEAQCYLYLLKYGPKTPSPLAKSLHTYREDVHRTLTVLIDKGMVRPSLNSPTLYTAVELDTALGSTLKKHEAALREMEARKRELEQLSQQQRFSPSDEVSTFKIIKTLKEFLTLIMPLATSLETEWLSVVPDTAIVVTSQFGFVPLEQEFIEGGGKIRSIVNITYPIVPTIRELLDIGEEIRHSNELGVLFTILDRRICISAINAELSRFTLDEPLTALYTDDPVYAQYLISTFELLWEQAIPAEERIQELLKQGPPKADGSSDGA